MLDACHDEVDSQGFAWRGHIPSLHLEHHTRRVDHTAFALFALDNNGCPFLQFLDGIGGNMHTFTIEHSRIFLDYGSNRPHLAFSLLWRVTSDDIGLFLFCIRRFANHYDLTSMLKEYMYHLWQLPLYIF